MESKHLLPKYLQISELILEEIRGLQEGDKLTSELMLKENYQCSRSTIRSAIAYLIERGYLVSKQGIGNIVTIPMLREEVEPELSFTQDVDKKGLKHKTIIEKVDFLKSAFVANIFGVAADECFAVISRRRYVNDALAVLEDTYLLQSTFNLLNIEHVEQVGLYRALDDIGKSGEMSIKEKLTPIILNEEQCKIFEVNEPTPMMSVIRIGSNENGVFEYTVSITDSGILEFTRNMKRG
ncbi:GntR family transcriptional regulator [Citrobacter sp. R56]|uniref:GntR family transcriptional regulator n=1 Tax=Citrobacter sp. R56 TaxID=1573676 RepID=UPI00193BEE47|nr:GntR family transcriptional regulator [Citrobacter sp. R56]QRG79643.1 GntR family transcriptional regulator [Citrobacter sp. R56]